MRIQAHPTADLKPDQRPESRQFAAAPVHGAAAHSAREKIKGATDPALPGLTRPAPRGQRAWGSFYCPVLNEVNVRVCTRLMSCGRESGTVIRARSSGLRNTLGLAATSFCTNFSEALFGLA
jgi:hypothetical protein